MKRSIGFLIVEGAVFGIAIGCLIELIFSSIFAGNYYVPGIPSFLVHFENINVAVAFERALYALIGVVSSLGTLLFKNEERPLIMSTAIHFVLIAITVCVVGVTLGWFGSWEGVAGAVASFVLVYVLIWVSVYFYERRIAMQATRRLHENETEKLVEKH